MLLECVGIIIRTLPQDLHTGLVVRIYIYSLYICIRIAAYRYRYIMHMHLNPGDSIILARVIMY